VDDARSAPAHRRRLPFGVVIALLSAAWTGVALVGTQIAGDHRPEVHRPVPALAVLVALVLSQAFVVNVQLHREARSVFISEIPVFLGLMSLSGSGFVVLRTVAAAIGFGLVRMQFRQPQKLAFNICLAAGEGGLAVAVLGALAGPQPSKAHLWLAAAVAASIASGCTGAGVALVIELIEGRPKARELLRTGALAVVGAAPVSAIGCVVWAAWDDDPWAAVPLTVGSAMLLWGYRAYASLREQHGALERLYRFNQVVSFSPELSDVLGNVLEQARDILHAEQARLTFTAEPGHGVEGFELRLDSSGLQRGASTATEDPRSPLAAVLRDGSAVLVPRGTKDAAQRAWLDTRGVRDGVLVPLMGEIGPIAVLEVGDRLGDVRGFEAPEVQLLETVAQQAAVALRNGELLEKLRHESLHDSLTGLPNRANFQRELDARLRSRESGLAVGIIDLDAFKEVNDTLGHQEGDRLLCEVAVRMSSALPDEAVVARLGGDEFAVILTCCHTPEAATAAGHRLLGVLAAPVLLAGIEVDVSASLGLSLAPEHGESVGVLLKRADQAMYDAKHRGRQVSVFDEAHDTSSPSKLALVAELRQAIERREVVVHFQAKVDAASRALRGAEALARWETPDRGFISPVEFIPLAERSGLIRPLTELVLDSSIAACAAWQADRPGVGVAVNISVRSLADEGLLRLVNRTLDRHRLPSELVTLEITESHIMADPAGALSVLEQLRARGLRLSVDDFGTGYSSLSYLRRLPVNEVKIDRSFVYRMTQEPDDAAIVRSIVELARTLGLHVVAEGVEDESTWAALAELGVDEIQGWAVSHPVPTADLLPVVFVPTQPKALDITA
jgi:diguanylate cyclase (GGDEF)-like protein